MVLSDFFPIWDKLTPSQQQLLTAHTYRQEAKKGAVIHSGNISCTGPLLVASGQLRAYMLSEDGREITLYRMLERDVCMLSAPCMLNSMQFDITIQAEKDTEVWIIPPFIYKQIMEQSATVANYTLEVIISRFSEVMWLMEQVLWKSFDKRLAAFLLNEWDLNDSPVLKITHETIGNHLGNPREVVTRMLRYFQNEGLVQLTRGAIELLDRAKLEALAE